MKPGTSVASVETERRLAVDTVDAAGGADEERIPREASARDGYIDDMVSQCKSMRTYTTQDSALGPATGNPSKSHALPHVG